MLRLGRIGCTGAAEQLFQYRGRSMYSRGVDGYVNLRDWQHLRVHGDRMPWTPMRKESRMTRVSVEVVGETAAELASARAMPAAVSPTLLTGGPAGDGEPWLPRHKGGLFWRRFRVAFARALLHVRRQRVLVAITALEHLLVGLLYGSNYYAPPHNYDGFLDVTACLFFTYVCAAVSSGAKAIPDFFAIKAVCARERQAGAISPLEHWLASGLATLCTGLTYALCLLVPVYTIAGFGGDFALFQACLYAILIAGANTTALVEFFCARAPGPQQAFALYPVVVMLSIHTAGYTIKL